MVDIQAVTGLGSSRMQVFASDPGRISVVVNPYIYLYVYLLLSRRGASWIGHSSDPIHFTCPNYIKTNVEANRLCCISCI